MTSRVTKNIIFIVVVALVLGALIFFSESRAVSTLRGGIVSVLTPLMRGSGGLSGIINQSSSVTRLQRRLVELEFTVGELTLENERLMQALEFKEINETEMRGARVLFYGRELGNEFLMIDQGSADGVVVGDVVIDANRMLIGLVRHTDIRTSRVAVASNSNESFEVEIRSIGARALANGLGGRNFMIDLLPSDSPVRRGDYVSLASPVEGRVAPILGIILSTQENEQLQFVNASAAMFAEPQLIREVFIIPFKIAE